ncbi:MAG: class I SAM-dependent methyltransferase [Burkholderiales bacterium]
MKACRICGNAEGNQAHFPKEMMFGWGEAFEYLECGRCGCLQIAEIPADLAKYYPREGYYSYKPPRKKQYPAWLLRLRHERTRHFLGEFSVAGALLGAISKRPEHFDWFRGRGVGLDSRIVDIGCGAGGLLLKLQREGFRSLLGADPFLESEIDYGNGVRILKCGVEGLPGEFDFAMLHHSFEHVLDPADTLRALRQRVTPGGTLLLRMPVADSHARKKYGLNWQAWEAPRHLHLHTVKSMELLAAGAGFDIAEIVYDSVGERLSSSELYIRGVPYVKHGRYRPGHSAEAFSHQEWDAFQAQAAELNARREGDTACFYLRPR